MSVGSDSGGFAVTNAAQCVSCKNQYQCKEHAAEYDLPFARRYSVRAMSSIVSRASASSLKNACSSSYSPGLPSRSRMMRPEPAQPDAQKMKTTSAIRIIDPKEETSPMMTPVKAEEGGLLRVMMENLMRPPGRRLEDYVWPCKTTVAVAAAK